MTFSLWIEKYRFKLLLFATLLVLIIPSFASNQFLSEILFLATMSFLFIQSMVALLADKNKKIGVRYAVVIFMIIILWIEPAGLEINNFNLFKLILLAGFFGFIIYSFIRFIGHSSKVTEDVILAAIIIYLLMGIIAGNLAFLLYDFYPNAFIFAERVVQPSFTDFLYFSFITMATVGYGDITPAIPQTETFAYLVAVTGQLYIAIIIALLVGKYLVARQH
jgi:voltage-gated potassium channel